MSDTFDPILIIAGLLFCLFGWTLYWAGLRLLGAACGAILGAILGGGALLLAKADQWVLLGAGAGAIVGVVLGIFLVTRMHYLLFFVTGAICGLIVAWVVGEMYREILESRLPAGPAGWLLYYTLASLISGVVVLLLHRYIMIILTAFVGTSLFVLGTPQRYAVWAALPLFLGSLLLQSGVLAALGQAGEVERGTRGKSDE